MRVVWHQFCFVFRTRMDVTRKTLSKRGQVALLFVGLLALVLALSLTFVANGLGEWQKVRVQSRLDAVALSGCSYLASGLNRLAKLNKKIKDIQTAMDLLVAYWNSLAVCSAGCAGGVGCACVAQFVRASEWIPSRLRSLSRAATAFEFAQDALKITLPYETHREMTAIAGKNAVSGVRTLSTLYVAVVREKERPFGNTRGILTAHPIFREIRYPRRLVLTDWSGRLHRIAVAKRRPDGVLVSVCRVKGDDLDEEVFEEILTH